MQNDFSGFVYDFEPQDGGPVNFGIVTRIEIMIYQSSLDDNKKDKLYKMAYALKNDSDAFEMINSLIDSQPIPGIDRPAGPQYEISQAVKNAADRDDFYEKRRTV